MVLQVLYPSNEGEEIADLKADVIAVHGLSGDLVNTWSNRTTNAFWLKDFLPKDVPNVRVMTFGYNARMAFGNTTADVIDHAKALLSSLIDKREEENETKRPIIFIGHSLGGIVIKQSLFQAKIEPRYDTIYQSTVGIMFLGTPHRGSDKAVYGKVLATLAAAFTINPAPSLLNALQTNSEALMRLTTDFRFQLPNYQVYSFYETRSMRGFSTLIVEKHSALLDVDKEEQIPVEADHVELCKFSVRTDETYEKLFKRIRRMLKPADTGLSAALQGAKGDDVAFQRLLQSQPGQINAKDSDGKTLLHHAAMEGNEAVVRALIRHEAMIDTEDFRGRTALHFAAGEGYTAVVKELLRRGAKVDAEDDEGKTPLHYAAENERVDVAVRLVLQDTSNIQIKRAKVAALGVLLSKVEAVAWWLKYGPELEAVDNNGDTMLHWAATNGQTTVMEVLLEKGIHLEARNTRRETALHSAAQAGCEGPTRLLLDNGADIEAKQDAQITPLLFAVDKGNEIVARLLLERGANTEFQSLGLTLLHTAAERGFTGMVSLLLRNGLRPSINAPNANRSTALHFASALGNDEMAGLLLANGADVKKTSSRGCSPLHVAGGKGSEAVMRRLLQEKDADINGRCSKGHTPLYYAVSNGHNAIARLLLEHGGDVNIKDNMGCTALHISAQQGHLDITRLLLDQKRIVVDARSNDGRTPLFLAAVRNRVSIMELLLERGADIAARSQKGDTALCHAATSGQESAVRLLLGRGASAKEQYPDKSTLLHHAVLSNSTAVVELLIAKGASVKAKTEGGTTVLHWAATKGNVQVIELLIRKRASVKQKNLQGEGLWTWPRVKATQTQYGS